MGRCIVAGGKPDMAAPVGGLLLSSIAEGSIVKLNENGSPVEFYVAKHDYEPSLNGIGRTLLVRKDCYDLRQWNNVNSYADSYIDTWLNGTYKTLLSAYVQRLIGTSKFRYTPGNGNTTIVALERSVFLLSVTELGRTYDYINQEGTELSVSNVLRIAYNNGSAVNQWTRTPATNSTNNACVLDTNGNFGGGNVATFAWSRPCFTLPSTVVFDGDTLLFMEAA